MPKIKYIDPHEFRDEGYLQEVNRRFFHPLGLAIEMFWSNDKDVKYAVVLVSDLEELEACVPRTPEFDDLRTSTYHAIESSGPAVFRGVWDYRDDPEGMNFADEPEHAEEFIRKADHIQELWRERRRARVQGLGYMVQPYGDHFTEIGSDIVALYGQALGDELHSVIPVKASSESWQKAARGVLDKICEAFAGEPYNPEVVTPEEVHLIDLLLGPEAVTGARTRAEAVNMVIDRGNFYKDVYEQASKALAAIASGDMPPGMTPQEVADMTLSGIAADFG